MVFRDPGRSVARLIQQTIQPAFDQADCATGIGARPGRKEQRIGRQIRRNHNALRWAVRIGHGGRARSDPQASRGTAEDFINLVMSEVRSQFYSDGEDERVGEQCQAFREDTVFRGMVTATASDSSIGLANAGPHLLFGEAWASFSAAVMCINGGVLNLQKDSARVAFACCHLLAKWSKAGYRLDWHPLRPQVQRVDPAAPVGRWTEEWARRAT